MLKIRQLNQEGIAYFKNWVNEKNSGDPPQALISDEKYSESLFDLDIDTERQFSSQYEFGIYILEVLKDYDFNELLNPEIDGMWNWLSVVYFKQLAPKKVNMFWRYIVTRSGAVGSLAYRHILRTAYELAYVHGEDSKICLSTGMYNWSDIEESLTSRQSIAHNRGFFRTATLLYVENEKIRRGAASKPKKKKLRKQGDKTGYGSVRRLAIALQRLDLTYDTEVMDSEQIAEVLPREFSKWRQGNMSLL
jgi:hypothetical protein